jgi:hypothetical protein
LWHHFGKSGNPALDAAISGKAETIVNSLATKFARTG